MVDLVLASSSPRRAELLRQLHLSFRVVPPEVSERPVPDELAVDFAARLSLAKAEAVFESLSERESTVVIGADTLVVLDADVLGKPQNRRDAIEMLMRLSGRGHSVVTGVSLVGATRKETIVTETIVVFRELTIEECENYWRTGEPCDKAGAYGIQGLGAIFVASIEGSYSNVVGLPLMETAERLRDFGVDCLAAGAQEF